MTTLNRRTQGHFPTGAHIRRLSQLVAFSDGRTRTRARLYIVGAGRAAVKRYSDEGDRGWHWDCGQYNGVEYHRQRSTRHERHSRSDVRTLARSAATASRRHLHW